MARSEPDDYVANVDLEMELQDPLLTPSTDNKQTTRAGRFEALDLFRGFIMVVMAWDHAKDVYIASLPVAGEGWQGDGIPYTNFWVFLARAVSDICAPGFFFTMGIGMALYTYSRLDKQVALWAIQRHFIERSIVLFLVGRVVHVFFHLPTFVGQLMGVPVIQAFGAKDVTLIDTLVDGLLTGGFQVMLGLSLSMLLATLFCIPFLQRFRAVLDNNAGSSSSKLGLLVSFAVFFLLNVVSNGLIVYYQHGLPSNKAANDAFPGNGADGRTLWDLLVRLLFIPGPAMGTHFAYPVVPWIGLTVLGLGFGIVFDEMKRHENNFVSIQRIYDVLVPRFAICFLIAFLIIRLFGGRFGNYRGWGRHEGWNDHPLISFFFTCKYPPSPAYTALTMGINFLFITFFAQEIWHMHNTHDRYTFSWAMNGAREVLMIFGTAPLFFYVMHLAILGTSNTLISLSAGIYIEQRDANIPTGNVGFKIDNVAYTVLIWIPLLIVLVPMCKRYGEFKIKQPVDSWWRML